MRSTVRGALNELDQKRIERKLLTAAEVPGQVILWRLVLAPYVAQYSGRIQTPEMIQRAEEVACSLGQILQVGHFVFRSKTVAGLDLAEEPHIPKVGQYVLHELYAGVALKLKGDRRLRIINDTDILMVVSDPEEIRGYL